MLRSVRGQVGGASARAMGRELAAPNAMAMAVAVAAAAAVAMAAAVAVAAAAAAAAMRTIGRWTACLCRSAESNLRAAVRAAFVACGVPGLRAFERAETMSQLQHLATRAPSQGGSSPTRVTATARGRRRRRCGSCSQMTTISCTRAVAQRTSPRSLRRQGRPTRSPPGGSHVLSGRRRAWRVRPTWRL